MGKGEKSEKVERFSGESLGLGWQDKKCCCRKAGEKWGWEKEQILT